MIGVVCAAACLPAGFAVADVTGVRPLGGLVLLALALVAGVLSGARLPRQAAWYAVVLVCFVLSHVLADGLGTWGAIAVVTAVATAAYAALLPTPSPLRSGS